jgi:hypothetical protein
MVLVNLAMFKLRAVNPSMFKPRTCMVLVNPAMFKLRASIRLRVSVTQTGQMEEQKLNNPRREGAAHLVRAGSKRAVEARLTPRRPRTTTL